MWQCCCPGCTRHPLPRVRLLFNIHLNAAAGEGGASFNLYSVPRNDSPRTLNTL